MSEICIVFEWVMLRINQKLCAKVTTPRSAHLFIPQYPESVNTHVISQNIGICYAVGRRLCKMPSNTAQHKRVSSAQGGHKYFYERQRRRRCVFRVFCFSYRTLVATTQTTRTHTEQNNHTAECAVRYSTNPPLQLPATTTIHT